MTDIREIMRDLVREYTIEDLIEAATRAALSQWNVQAACTRLGVSRPTMYNRMERYGIPRPTNHVAKLSFRK